MRGGKAKPEAGAGLRRGIAILPSIFTLANMLCGYSAIVAASRQDFDLAVMLVVVAIFLDGLDGRIARMTNTTSEFGVQLDSLTDFLSFGIAPALILYHWGTPLLTNPDWLRRTAWLFPFLLPVAGAIRLARFNVQAHVADKRFFVGLAIPAAAGASVIPLWFLPKELPPEWKFAALCYVVVLSWLMVSRIRYRSFKQLDMRTRRSGVTVFLLAALMVAVAFYPKPVLLGIALTYAASGPLGWLWEHFRPAQEPPRASGGPKADAP